MDDSIDRGKWPNELCAFRNAFLNCSAVLTSCLSCVARCSVTGSVKVLKGQQNSSAHAFHIPQPYSASESNDIERTLAIVWGIYE